jgi:hypothetical protein
MAEGHEISPLLSHIMRKLITNSGIDRAWDGLFVYKLIIALVRCRQLHHKV